MPTSNRTIKKYRSIMERGLFEERELIGFRSLINKSLRLNWVMRTADERISKLADDFFDIMPTDGYRLTPEQQAKGIAYLRSLIYLDNGNRRNTKFVREQMLDHYWDIIDNYSHFTLVDLESPDNGSLPIYRLWAKDGRYLDYVGASWQYGGSYFVGSGQKTGCTGCDNGVPHYACMRG